MRGRVPERRDNLYGVRRLLCQTVKVRDVWVGIEWARAREGIVSARIAGKRFSTGRVCPAMM